MKEYFSHDYNARNDKKLIKLFMKHGVSGIGIYWCIVEMLFEESGYLNIDEYERISFELRTDNETIKSVIESFELFENDGIKFWSESALDRLTQRIEKSEKARKSVEKRWEKHKRNTNVKQTNNERNTSKVKESKVKESKVNPSKVEIENYGFEKGYKLPSQKIIDHYTNGGELDYWIDANNKKVKRWKSKISSVWLKDEYKMNNSEIAKQNEGINLNDFKIPHSDNFGYQKKELIQMCKDGKYPKK